ncbi:uncharacterized protein [Tenebrio molitor]|uniref:uncharacterized protein isoform X5 n=1 Tax=Tenebrio molitor TaxID=7067 RepID=UPI003624923D
MFLHSTNYIIMITFLLLVLSIPIPLLSEDITLRKGNEIICLSNIDSPIYLDPPFAGKHNSSTNFLHLAGWDKDNWIIKNENEIIGPVIDKRWEGFQIDKSKVEKIVNSQSFSIYSSSEIELLLTNPTYQRRFKLSTTEQGWTHFTLVIVKHNVHVLQNGKVVFDKAVDFEPNAIAFKRAKESYWKFHEHQFRWSNTSTVTNETPTTLAIPPITKKCLLLYIYLCEKCSLTIPEFNLTYRFRSETGFNSWQTDRIDITPKEETKISLVKSKTDGNEHGDWGIYIAECPEIIDNKAVYRENVSIYVNNSTTLCQELNVQRRDENNINKENQTRNDGFSCEPGKFGNDCMISCKDILGVDERYCQKHKICHESKCECAWGYEGSECDSECEKGHWGLSCNGTCQEGCEICNHITGECTDNTNNGTIIGTVNSNIITLQNNSYVTCVSANISSPIFVIPLNTTVNGYTSSMLEKIDLTADNWILKNERVVGSVIVDKRWEDLFTIKSNYQMFNSTKSISFSLYVHSVTKIDIFINDEQNLEYFQFEIKNTKKWNHYAISVHNNNVYVLENGQTIRTTLDFNPYEFVIKSKEDIFWKIHNYSSIWANRTTKEQPTVLFVPSIENLSYVVFYVSLCKECFLEIVVNGTNNHKTSIYSRHESSSILKSWREHVLEIQPFQETKIKFYRRTREFEDYGLWEVDIRWYSGKTQYRLDPSNLTTYYACHTLDGLESEDENNETMNTAFDCEPGKLGKYCNMSCNNVLGNEFEYCEKHRICQGSQCGCAWGYQGSLCQQSCENGSWGFSCSNKCDALCTSDGCDKVTGKCNAPPTLCERRK